MNEPFGRAVRQLASKLFLACTLLLSARAAPSGEVDVILWFDTEDYLLPADDDAAKRLAEMLTARGIRATFKVVGEKARVLERRGRRDVIEALAKHEIGYHANFHSVHPTPTEYLADCGWLDGINEFTLREGGGAADVRRIFGLETLACYGQPGSSWAPQAIAALPNIGVQPHGVPCYVDEGTHVGLDQRPFWYAGALNVYHMGENYTRMELHDPAAVAPAERKAAEIIGRLRKEGGGLLSIFYHPCEWVHVQFWDGVNFARGANPPREQWKPPAQLPAAETEAAFARFGAYIDSIRNLPGVRWVTAGDLPGLYPDQAVARGARESDVDELAQRILSSPGRVLEFQRLGDREFSLADQFEVFMRATADLSGVAAAPTAFEVTRLLGPGAPPPPSVALQTDGYAFRDALSAVTRHCLVQHAVPARIFIGSQPAPPADFLATMAAVWVSWRKSGVRLPDSLALVTGARVGAERFVAADTPKLFGDWVIHREGFRAPQVMEQARLQAWTLKPALRIP